MKSYSDYFHFNNYYFRGHVYFKIILIFINNFFRIYVSKFTLEMVV